MNVFRVYFTFIFILFQICKLLAIMSDFTILEVNITLTEILGNFRIGSNSLLDIKFNAIHFYFFLLKNLSLRYCYFFPGIFIRDSVHKASRVSSRQAAALSQKLWA